MNNNIDNRFIIIVLLSSLMIFFLYIIIYRKKEFKNIAKEENDNSKKYLIQDKKVRETFKHNSKLRYISDYARYPITTNNDISYYKETEELFSVILEELKKAKKFIFMEYFTIAPGKFWDSILKILEEKVKSGVEVRVIYDDVGSLNTLNKNYPKYLEERGIKCLVFNRINPISFLIMNNRNHRKMTIIDGKVAFTGGINIADECINLYQKYGYWKDGNIKIVGDGVWNYTIMFLSTWNYYKKEDKEYLKYKYNFKNKKYSKGFIGPYGDTQLDKRTISRDVYLNIINQADKYVYITTPYLIIDKIMNNSLILAAKRGVDVRIIIPAIPDKKLIYIATESYVAKLLQYGIKVYRYTPGFIHAKVFLADDKIATVGTINIDYRSLYLHFECGCYIENDKVIDEIKNDIENTLNKSELINKENIKQNFIKQILQIILKLFAPLM